MKKRTKMIRSSAKLTFITEDVETDNAKAELNTQAASRIQRGILKAANEPKFSGNRLAWRSLSDQYPDITGFTLTGQQLGLEGALKNLRVMLIPQGAVDYSAGMVLKGVTQPTMLLSVLNPDGNYGPKLAFAGAQAIQNEQWHMTIRHELVHALQNATGNLNTKRRGTNGLDATGYFNDPAEFDAYYHEVSHSLNNVLSLLRKDQQAGIQLANKIGVTDSLTGTLQALFSNLPESVVEFIQHLKENRYRRLLKRLYATHQSIRKEMSTMRENHEANHANALKDTGFWGKAGAGCIIVAQSTGNILMPLRSQWVQEPGTWGTWGGAIDGDEDPKEAAIREVREEAGYGGGVIRTEHLFRFQKNDFRYDTFLVVIAEEFEPTLNWETEKAEWMSLDQLPDNLHFGLKDVLAAPGTRNKIASAGK